MARRILERLKDFWERLKCSHKTLRTSEFGPFQDGTHLHYSKRIECIDCGKTVTRERIRSRLP